MRPAVIAALLVPMSLCLAQDPPEVMLSYHGLSGLPGLTTTDVVPTGFLSLQGTATYARLSEHFNSLHLLLAGSYGITEGLELGGNLPVYLDDDRDDAILGDLEIAGKYRYQGGGARNSVALLARLSLPTGAELRDPGMELGLGFTTTSSFREFRLSGSFQYVIVGGHNPFEDDLEDYASFEFGGTSFIRSDVQLFLSGRGTTCGSLIASGGGSALLSDAMKVCFFAEVGIEGAPDFAVGVGLNYGFWL